MSAADTAKLLASLDMDTRKFQAGGQKAIGTLDKISTKTVAVGTAIGTGLERLAEAGIRKVGSAITGGLDSLATLESAVGSVDAAIKQVGLTGQVTGSQIAGWANEIEANIGAAFDDKDITQAATTLIRFGKVTAANIKPALVVMTDLATKTAGKLARAGVVLTKSQQDQIKALVKAGKTGQAQTLILNALSTATKG